MIKEFEIKNDWQREKDRLVWEWSIESAHASNYIYVYYLVLREANWKYFIQSD